MTQRWASKGQLVMLHEHISCNSRMVTYETLERRCLFRSLKVAGTSAQQSISTMLGEGGDELLRESTFPYQLRTQQQRFLLELMTTELDKNASKHCHRGVLYVDGRFNLTREKVLVLFLMSHDESGKGFPRATLLFTPDPKARSASASYDSLLLQKMLEK